MRQKLPLILEPQLLELGPLQVALQPLVPVQLLVLCSYLSFSSYLPLPYGRLSLTVPHPVLYRYLSLTPYPSLTLAHPTYLSPTVAYPSQLLTPYSSLSRIPFNCLSLPHP